MSNQLAIAAVTRSIQGMLRQSGIETLTLTPDKAARQSGVFLNLFLYHTMHNATWRNQDIPGRVRKSERGNPPLALNLYYLISAYGEGEADLKDQQLLGGAMRILHDQPILKSKFIEEALSAETSLLASQLTEQIDRVRIVPEYLDIENMSRLWTTFQTQYRVSAAYQASVVLIESQRPSPSPLPVTKRGDEDQGVLTDVGLEPSIISIEYRGDPSEPALSAATIGSFIIIRGENLPQEGVTVVVRDPKAEPSDNVDSDVIARLTPTASLGNRDASADETNKSLKILLDESAGYWRAGLVTLELELNVNGVVRTSNSIPLAIAPKVLTSGGEASVVASIDEQDGKRLLSVSLANPTGEKRKVYLTLNPFTTSPKANSGFFQIPAGSSELGNALAPVFDITQVPRGDYWVRIRVEGIDSILMKKERVPETGKFRIDFDPEQRIQL